MLVRLRHASARRLPGPLDRLPALKHDSLVANTHAPRGTRNAASSSKTKTKKASALAAKDQSLFLTNTPTAEKLAAAGLWQSRSRTGKGLETADTRRINVVNEQLCDDIIKVIGPSLERHRGCDLIDINPGAGLWSRTLHDAVQPRRHIMLDATAEAYSPILKETMGGRANVEVIQKNGLDWANLKKTLEERISPHHTPLQRHRPGPDGLLEVPPSERNDTLLVTANVGTYPKRSIYGFDSLATMVLYQLISSIRTSTLFQRYGCVRMLVWANDENKRTLLPRVMLNRKRACFETEMACEWFHEVAGHDHVDANIERFYLRDDWMNIESTAGALQRMERAGIPIIPDRETKALQTVLADPNLRNGVGKLAGHEPPKFLRPFKAELERFSPIATSTEEDQVKLRKLQRRMDYDTEDSQIFLELLQKIEASHTLAKTSDDPSSPETQAAIAALDAEVNERVDAFKKNHRSEFGAIRDSYHLFRHATPHPALLWDRRAYEPLVVRPADDFYPNVPMCLLDIQPKAMDPLLRQFGPGTSRSGDMSDLLLRMAWSNPAYHIETRGMDNLWPGFASMTELVDPDTGERYCSSLRDSRRGGSPLTEAGALTTRAMNEGHWLDMMKAWMDWPFKPSYESMIGRLTMDQSDDMGADRRGVI